MRVESKISKSRKTHYALETTKDYRDYIFQRNYKLLCLYQNFTSSQQTLDRFLQSHR